MRYLVAGLARTGLSVIDMAKSESADVVGYDDDASVTARVAEQYQIETGSTAAFLQDALGRVEVVVVSPGFPLHHPLRSAAAERGVQVLGDLELAMSRTTEGQLIAVTGTNGKSTVTRLIAEMIAGSGHSAIEAGNVGFPILEAIQTPADFYVVEASSFQLFDTESFHPRVGVWTNVSPDHLDWHPSIEHYVAAKTRIWANQSACDVAVANAEDPVVMQASGAVRSRCVTFGAAVGDARAVDGQLTGPEGEDLGVVAGMARPFPHEVVNGLAAACAALAVGVDAATCARILAEFRGLPHRLQLVGHIGGVPCFDDSKATTPASVVTALRAFPSAVLIAGGKNKGLDLSVLAQAEHHVRAVVAIGAAAEEVAAVFEGRRPVSRAASMLDAVEQAVDAARDGDAVLLSPACTSWDAYRDYAERGDDFARAVKELEAQT